MYNDLRKSLNHWVGVRASKEYAGNVPDGRPPREFILEIENGNDAAVHWHQSQKSVSQGD
jgi:hypothetical protein